MKKTLLLFLYFSFFLSNYNSVAQVAEPVLTSKKIAAGVSSAVLTATNNEITTENVVLGTNVAIPNYGAITLTGNVAIPPGAVVTSANVVFTGFDLSGGSIMYDFYAGASGAGTLQNSIISSRANGNKTYSKPISNLTNGTITLTVYDDYHNGFYTTSATVQNITLTYTYSITKWYDSSTGGNLLGTGNTLETVGTSVLPNTITTGTYNFYAEAINASGTSSRTKSTVTVVPLLDASIISNNLTCNGMLNGSATAVTSGGESPLTYQWLPGGNTQQNISSLTAGTYTLKVTDAIGQTATSSVLITQPNAITITPSQTNLSCRGSANGSASAIVTGGTGSYTYQWSPSGGRNASATGLAAGTYTVTVTDANSCTATQSFTITEPDKLVASKGSQTNIASRGTATGSATVNVTGGTGPYYYSWAPSGGTSATATGLSAGTYTVTVTDDNTCTATQSFTITEPDELIVSKVSQTNIACHGEATGSATVSVAGGTGSYSYSWSPSGGTSATATGLNAGTYTVTVTDANAYTAMQSFTITEPVNPLTASKGTIANVNCHGEANGSATVNVTGGTGSYSYSWAPSGGTGATASGLASGTYTVTVTDSNGCTTTQGFTITEPASSLSATIASARVSCFGGGNGSASVSVSGGSPNYTYSWAPFGGTAATATGLSAGDYTCTITDSKGCTLTKTVTVGTPAQISGTITKTDVSCNGGSNGSATVTASGGVGSYSYSWSPTGGNAATASGLSKGNYTVTIQDGNSCVYTVDVTIDEPSVLTASISHTDILCNGGATGTATVIPSGGTGTYSYLWSPSGGTGATAIGLAMGTYNCKITDSNGCFVTRSIRIDEPTILSATTSQIDATCMSAGQAAVNVSGGVGPYTYSWSPSGQTAAVATGLNSGSHSCLITDSNGCKISKTFLINTTNTLIAATSKNDILCNGTNTGSASVVPSGAPGPFTYVWAPTGGSSNTASNLAAGNYSVTIISANGCSIVKNFTITEPSALTVTPSQTNLLCNGVNTGSASVSVSGGTGSYTYAWAPSGGTSATATGLSAGTYTVTVTDANSCTATQSFTITEPNVLTTTAVSQTNIACHGANTGSATVGVSGGKPGYSYFWAPSGGNSATATGLSAGTYTVTVTDANSCTVTQSFTITEPNVLIATAVSQTNIACHGANTGSATVGVSGGKPGYSYSWAPSGGNSATATGLSAGTYTVTVTDANSCTTTQSFTITEPNVLSCSITQDDPAKCYGDNNGKATVVAIGGNGEYTYLWDNGETTAQAIGLTAGTHEVTVTDKLGYKTKCSVVISQPQAPLAAAIDSKTDVNCKGDATGSATASATGGNGTYSYTWNTVPVQNTATATNLVAGTYIVTVTDSKGCIDTETVTIGEPSNTLVAAIDSKTDVSCKGDATGSATASATGGTAGYSYSWNTVPVQTGATATNLVAGTYIVTVTDSKGCTDTETVTIGEPTNALLAAIDSKTDVSCKGDATGSATASATGGTAGYSYSWNTVPVQTGATASNLVAGTYIVTVTDSKGCTDTETVTIGEPSAVLSCSVVQNKAVSSNGLSDGEATVTPLGGNGGYTYLWDNNETTQKAIALSAGLHSVTVTDSKGCKTTCTVTITEPNVLSCSITQDDPAKCYGDNNGKATVVAIGGNGEYTYLWDNGETTAQATGLTAGLHNVTVTDKLGYTTTCTVTIGQPQSALTASITSKTDVNCKGDATGSATASATGGNGTYSYSWNTVPVQNTATATGLIAGTYIVTVTDKLGCKTKCSVVISQPQAPLAAAIDSKTDVNCKGDATGSATASATGGNGTYSYTWNTVPVQNTATATNLVAGTYIVTVTDSKGCIDTETVTIGEPSNTLVAAIASKTDVSCKGDATGSATASATGGTGTYSYSWNTVPVQTSATATGLIAGTYIVTVTDEKGCTDTEQVIISEPQAPLTATKSQINPGCGGAATGSATVVASGGTAPYIYSWNTNPVQTTATASNLASGSYTVIITDAKGCTHSESFEIIDGDSILPVIDPLPATSTINCPAEPVFAQATATDLNGTISSLTYEDTVTPGDCAGSYTKTRTWTAKDACGNVSLPVSQTIIVQDITAPTWKTEIASLNRTVECSDQQALASAQALFPTATDACDTDVSNIVKVSGQFMASEGCSNAGTYTNTWTVKDACGNTSETFTQVITIQDTTAPTWTTQTASLNKTIECSNQEALASAQALFPTATDTCDTDVSNVVKVSGQFIASEGCANSGTYTNTWTVKDDCGNTSATFTQVITIQDTTAPTWTTQTASLNKTIECSDQEALASAQALFPTATDACDTDVSNVVKVSGQFVASEGCSNAGTYTNTWTVKDDCGNTSGTFTQIITIQDTTNPVFNGELPTDITVSCDAVPEPANVQASDNCGGDLPIVLSETKSDIKNECGTEYTLTRKWTTSDCSGNTASFTQIITVRDTTPPTGTAPANVAGLQSTAEIPTGSPDDITDEADNCGGKVTVTVSDSNNGANGCDGNAYVLTRTYTLTDCAGNKTELVQTFTVDNKVSVSGVPTNVSCLDGTDGSIAVTSSPGATVVITNANNEVVGNTNLPAGTYTLTATAPVNGEGQVCTATATVTITQPNYKVKVSGQVINVDTNTPIANVPVTLIPQGTTPGPILIRITNANGEYSFSGMVAGSYLVQVQDANLNSAYQLYPVNSSLFFTTLEECKFQVHDFLYGKSKLPVLGDYVWYDTNSNGIQDEWYDANNDGVVTKNIPDADGAIDYSLWEWLDLNGDGSYTGPQNAGELNAGGFGNAKSANVIVDGPNGYHDEVIVGIQGFWRNRPEGENPYGEYKVKLVRDANLDAVAAALGATGLVKVLPSTNTDKKAVAKTGKTQMHTVCTTTSADGYVVNVTPEDLVHLDIDFGVNCKEYQDIVANDDNGGPFPGVNHTTPNVLNVLTNDTLEGQPITASDVIITTVTPNEFLQLNPDGSVDILPNAPVGTLTMVYQICEADQTSNCDTATVTITIEAPVMTVTATSICVNDVPYLDYSATPVNFTPVNGVTITWADSNNNVVTTMTNLPLSGRVLWPGAVVDQNGNGIDWPGWVFQDNKWIQAPDGFENLRPTATVTISVNPSETIVVNYPPADPYCIARPTFAIVANDDTAGPINGTTGGTNVINVYTNDTLNGSPVNPSDVTLTTVTPDPKGVLTLNPDGSITVAPNTPAGTYTLTYQICENADFGNCDTAIVTVTVSSSPIVANDDSYTNIGCNRFGVVGNLLSNDLLNGLPVTLQLVNFSLVPQNTDVKSDPNITVDTAGNLTVGSATASGTYTYTYQICEKLNPNNCDTGTITITVIPNGVTTVSSSACNDDSTLIDLLALLPADTPRNGTWVDTNNTNALRDGILNALGLAIGNYAFEYKIADQNCPRSIVLNMEINDDCKVLPCENIVVHNAFSPNGDGINDVFVIDGIGDLTCYPGNTVEIYNRWGILVFETTDYNNTTNAFDGTSRGRTTVKQSEGLPTGTYFYIVTYKSLDGNNVIQYNKKDGYLYLSK
ncbi:T9SS type B sorting domain-containing protein [Flavobacterium resistens]|uniref:T9SS type B sorting domain-containing protein n=1 Tax=Flavobacterium resistens TaxID=443612 RepID=A0ABW9Q3L5_9FLAO|nr:gliding motility-associated C-terminal domain-containing protein [Flavobacterium resistens]MRX67633.1 T9SS type B sorting domain-containing protein [Flavobacterium resistens]